MKISAVETLRLADHPNLLWVRVHADNGLTGLGETYFGASACEADIHDRIAPIILGEDARKIEYMNMKMQPYTCLLYTSPSPRDATLSRMPSSA